MKPADHLTAGALELERWRGSTETRIGGLETDVADLDTRLLSQSRVRLIAREEAEKYAGAELKRGDRVVVRFSAIASMAAIVLQVLQVVRHA